jgi:hypothetical protein
MVAPNVQQPTIGMCLVDDTQRVAEVHGSRTHPRPRWRPRNGFEDREAHRDPCTPMRDAPRSITVKRTAAPSAIA